MLSLVFSALVAIWKVKIAALVATFLNSPDCSGQLGMGAPISFATPTLASSGSFSSVWIKAVAGLFLHSFVRGKVKDFWNFLRVSQMSMVTSCVLAGMLRSSSVLEMIFPAERHQHCLMAQPISKVSQSATKRRFFFPEMASCILSETIALVFFFFQDRARL